MPQLAIWWVVIGEDMSVCHVGTYSYQSQLVMWQIIAQNCVKSYVPSIILCASEGLLSLSLCLSHMGMKMSWVALGVSLSQLSTDDFCCDFFFTLKGLHDPFTSLYINIYFLLFIWHLKSAGNGWWVIGKRKWPQLLLYCC